MKGLISNIQRFSLTDGDGIRTTVFFKGCNMKCNWCHNPETLSGAPELMFYTGKCIGCGKCFAACPEGAHSVVDGKHVIDRERCTACGKCAAVCYAEALVMCGKEMSVDEVMREVRQDKAYYDSSKGGVTLSGGEVLCQRDFAMALADACHAEDIRVALETNLCFAFDHLKPLAEKADLIMCDLKLMDEAAHKANTGVSNKNIMQNIKLLDSLGIPMIVRTPLVPGVTDGEENLISIAKYIGDMKNLVRYEVLNFNPLGEGKYKSLDADNRYEKVRPHGEAKLSEIRALLGGTGIPYKIV